MAHFQTPWQWGGQEFMKKCHVHTSSIHGGGFVGVGSLWPFYYIPHPNIFVLDVVYNLKCFNMGSNVSIPV